MGASDAQVELGLRERKKLQTRQRISDLATVMFLDQGFEAVRVADIAARSGVSEKTVYNYFPTKESLVFDQFDEQLSRALAAVTHRPLGTSPIRAYVDELKRQVRAMISDDFEQAVAVVPRFGEMLDGAPTLRAAWGDHLRRVVTAVAGALADELGVDALDPEPRTAARALVSLTELSYDATLRHITVARSPEEFERLIGDDLERGARLLDTGMWSLSLMIGGRHSAQQSREARRVADEARRQVMAALRDARRARRAAAVDRRSADRRRAETAPPPEGRRLKGRGRA